MTQDLWNCCVSFVKTTFVVLCRLRNFPGGRGRTAKHLIKLMMNK